VGPEGMITVTENFETDNSLKSGISNFELERTFHRHSLQHFDLLQQTLHSTEAQYGRLHTQSVMTADSEASEWAGDVRLSDGLYTARYTYMAK
jgi:hypothetical protein